MLVAVVVVLAYGRYTQHQWTRGMVSQEEEGARAVVGGGWTAQDGQSSSQS
jgi:hypothetical protein